MASGTTIGNALAQASAAATNAGITGSAQTTLLASLGSIFSGLFTSANPNKATEQAIVAEIMANAGNVPSETGLLAQLSVELGLPPAAQRIVADMQQNLLTLKPSDVEQMGNMIDEIIARGS
jgi:hypothetical protein